MVSQYTRDTEHMENTQREGVLLHLHGARQRGVCLYWWISCIGPANIFGRAKIHASRECLVGLKRGCILFGQEGFYGATHGMGKVSWTLLRLGMTEDRDGVGERRPDSRLALGSLVLGAILVLVLSSSGRRVLGPVPCLSRETKTWRCIALSRDFCYVGL